MDAREMRLIRTVALVDRAARRTSPARVGRIDVRHPDAGERRLVLDDASKSRKTPCVHPPTRGFPTRLHAATDMGQILEDERVAGLARRDQALGQYMIAIAAETSQTVSEDLEFPLRRPGAFRLKPSAERQHPLFDRPPSGFSKKTPVARDRGLAYPPVDADDFAGGDGFLHLAAIGQ